MPSSHFSLLHNVQTNSETHSASASLGTGCIFLQKLNTTANVVHNITKNAFVKNYFTFENTLRVRLHWSQNRQNTANQHLSGYTLQERVATFNPSNPELNPICYLLALLGAHHFLHVSRIRVKSLTRRLLMSYIYGAPILDVSRSHTTTQHSR